MTTGKQRRREIVERVRQEGRDAFAQGKPMQTCPYPRNDMSSYQWRGGYHAAQEEAEQQKRDEAAEKRENLARRLREQIAAHPLIGDLLEEAAFAIQRQGDES